MERCELAGFWLWVYVIALAFVARPSIEALAMATYCWFALLTYLGLIALIFEWLLIRRARKAGWRFGPQQLGLVVSPRMVQFSLRQMLQLMVAVAAVLALPRLLPLAAILLIPVWQVATAALGAWAALAPAGRAIRLMAAVLGSAVIGSILAAAWRDRDLPEALLMLSSYSLVGTATVALNLIVLRRLEFGLYQLAPPASTKLIRVHPCY